jgi:hypothetical protein
MRKLVLAVAVAGLTAVPAYGQFGFGGGQQAGNNLLLRSDVQKELKLTDEQKEQLADIQKSSGFGLFFKVAKEAGKDKEKFTELMEKYQKESAKRLEKVAAGLNKDQKKRLDQIDVQAGLRFQGVRVFTREKVQKALKLTADQKTKAEEAAKEFDDDVKEIMPKFGGFKKGKKGKKGGADFKAAFAKVDKLRKKTVDEYLATLSDAQKATLKEIQGEPFEFAAFGGGKKFKKGKKDAKKDDA